jgi:hypothetical protein
MPYEPTVWTNEVPEESPIKYKISQASEGDVATDATIEIVTPVIPGTSLNANNLNHLEEGVEIAQDTAEEADTIADAAQVSANTGISNAALAQTKADTAYANAAGAQTTANAAIPKSLATVIGQILYSTAANIWEALAKPSVDSVLKNTSTGVLSWKAINDFVLKSQFIASLSAIGLADSTYSGITQPGTAGTILGFGYLVYLSPTDSKWELADADAVVSSFGTIGICVQAAAENAATLVLLWGSIRSDARFPTLTVGAPVFVSTTGGYVQTNAPGSGKVVRIAGYGNAAKELFICGNGSNYMELI